jgi:ferredoxin
MGVAKRNATFVLKVNPIACDGFGHCHELAPELIDVDEWGYPVIKTEPTPLTNVRAVQSAKYAVRGCPRQALKIERLAESLTEGPRT